MRERIVDLVDGRQGSAAVETTPSQADIAYGKTVDRNDLCRRLERMCPEAVALSSTQISALHSVVNATELCGNRTPKDLREILRAEEPITGEDVARFAIQAPDKLCVWLAPMLVELARRAPEETRSMLASIAPLLSCALTPVEQPPAADALLALADAAEATAAFESAYIRDVADGVIDHDHTSRQQRAIDAISKIRLQTGAVIARREGGR